MITISSSRHSLPSMRTDFAPLEPYAGAIPLHRLERLLRSSDWRHLREHERFEAEGYCRRLLHSGPALEALLLCWLPGQASPIHDHHGSACAFRILRGTATETQFVPTGHWVRPTTMKSYSRGTVCGSYDDDIHEVANWNDEPLVTLHLYSPPLRDGRTYNRIPSVAGINVA